MSRTGRKLRQEGGTASVTPATVDIIEAAAVVATTPAPEVVAATPTTARPQRTPSQQATRSLNALSSVRNINEIADRVQSIIAPMRNGSVIDISTAGERNPQSFIRFTNEDDMWRQQSYESPGRPLFTGLPSRENPSSDIATYIRNGNRVTVRILRR